MTSPPLRVVVLPSWYPAYQGDLGGIFFREQAQALARAGVQVTVLAPQRRSLRRLLKEDQSLERLPDLDERLAPYVSTPNMPIFDVPIWRHMARRLYHQYVAEHGVPHVIHAHSLHAAGLLATELPASAHVLTEHSSAFLGPAAASLLTPHHHILQRYSHRIAVSSHLAAHLENLVPAGGNWEVVPNLVDTSRFDATSHRSSRLRVFTLSNLKVMKRVDMLIRAFCAAFPDGDADLVVGGDGEERIRLKALAASLPCSECIHFLGALDRQQVRSEFAQCSFFALASEYETFGVVLIEALAMGRPVVATNSGGPSSIVHSKNGLLVPLHDELALSQAMQRMATNLRDYVAAELRADCVARFSAEAVSARLIALYEQALRHAG